jgi:hypothetical protein
MIVTNNMQRDGIHAACHNFYGRDCTYPDCVCGGLPEAVKRALDAVFAGSYAPGDLSADIGVPTDQIKDGRYVPPSSD